MYFRRAETEGTLGTRVEHERALKDTKTFSWIQIHQQPPFNLHQIDHPQSALVFVVRSHNVSTISVTHLTHSNSSIQGSASADRHCVCSLPLPLYLSRYQQAKRDQLRTSPTQVSSEKPQDQLFSPSSEDTTPTNQLRNLSPKQTEQSKPNMVTTQ